jgi:hypothetical protein
LTQAKAGFFSTSFPALTGFSLYRRKAFEGPGAGARQQRPLSTAQIPRWGLSERRYLATNNLEIATIEPPGRASRVHKLRPRRRHDDLALGLLSERHEQRGRSSAIELAGHVVKEQDGPCATGLSNDLHLGKLERENHGPMLAL